MKLCNYKGLNLGKPQAIPTSEEELVSEIEKMLSQNVAFDKKEGKSELGDTCNINYEGFLDGVPFDGGKADGYDLELGSNTFIPGFEDGLVGFSAGDDVDVNVTFPTEYHAADLAGKPVVFKCHVNEVKTKKNPEFNDEFANKYGMPTKEAFKSELKRQMDLKKQNDIDNEYLGKLINEIIAASEIEVLDEAVKSRIDEMVSYYEQNISQYGLDFNTYLGIQNMTLEQFRDQLAGEAVNSVKSDLVLDEIATLESLLVTEEELAIEFNLYKDYYNWDDEMLNKFMADKKDAVKNELLRRKTAKFLLDSNN